MNTFLAFAALSLFTASCNMGENKDTTNAAIVATDSSMMSRDSAMNKTAASGMQNDTTSMNKMDPAAMNKMEPSMIKPNLAKKGMKGKVSINMAENSKDADMNMKDNEGYYTNVYPSYPGGTKALEKYFENNIQYPADASDNGIEGAVNVSFSVDEKGKVSGVKTTNPTIGYGLEAEALRVFNKMPIWKPGALKGKNVKTKYTLPVRFQLY